VDQRYKRFPNKTTCLLLTKRPPLVTAPVRIFFLPILARPSLQLLLYQHFLNCRFSSMFTPPAAKFPPRLRFPKNSTPPRPQSAAFHAPPSYTPGPLDFRTDLNRLSRTDRYWRFSLSPQGSRRSKTRLPRTCPPGHKTSPSQRLCRVEITPH